MTQEADSEPAGGAAQDGAARASDDAELVFRAVSAGGERRGIRLERVFWTALAEVAAARGQSLGLLVGGIAASMPPGGNLASALRVAAARFLRDGLAEAQERSAPKLVFALLQACPTPAFALSADKRIVSYNRPFVAFIQSRFHAADPAEMLRGLRLSLDMPLEQIVARLMQDPQAQVTTGYALGLAERRVRGQLRMALAPTAASPMAIAYPVEA